MNSSRSQHLRASRFLVAGATLLMSASLACHAPAVGAQPMGSGAAPDLAARGSQYSSHDAVILRWVQHWTLDRDGTLHRRNHQWVRLHNSRPIRRYGDPRIDFVHGRDELIIHTAQSHLPDGTVLPDGRPFHQRPYALLGPCVLPSQAGLLHSFGFHPTTILAGYLPPSREGLGVVQIGLELILREVEHGNAVAVQTQQEADPIHDDQSHSCASGDALHLA